MDTEYSTLKFTAEMVDSLVWPILAVILALIFREPISVLIQSAKKLKYKEFEVELTDDEATDDPDENRLRSILSDKARSFHWIRRNSPISYSDKQFRDLISKETGFKSAKIQITKADSSIIRREGIKLDKANNKECI